MSPYQPIGERARWRVLYEMLQAAQVDEVVKYEDMATVLDLDADDDRHAIHVSFRRAAKEYEQEDSRAVEVIPNVGYRIVEPDEHLRLAKGHQRKAGKSLERGQSKIVNVDLNGLDPEVRRAFEVTARAFALMLDYNRRLDTRQDRLEAALDGMTNRTARTEDEIAELKSRLARLEDEGEAGERRTG
jgi:hypothetical protein